MTTIRRPDRIRGTLRVPADKSISHRALLLNAIADGQARIRNLLDSADVRATARCLLALGVNVDWRDGEATVHGKGLHGLQEAEDVLDCGNSGTTIRLLAGVLAGAPMLSVLTGDASLRRRPMDRIVRPLREMGATIFARRGDSLAPLVIKGGALRGIEYRLPVASAQVKSAVLLAGLFADTPTTVVEPAPTRDHTERLLLGMGVEIRRETQRITLRPPERLAPVDMTVPGDISSAAPWLTLAACHPDAEITIEGVNVNPTRTGFLDILVAMGADLRIEHRREEGGEPVADISVRTSQLRGTTVSGSLVPRAIDELPLVALLAASAEGVTEVRDAAELRVKESDRIAAVAAVLGRFGVRVETFDDGFRIQGPMPLQGATIDALGDHRIGMLAGIAGALADGETRVFNDAVDVSYPSFWAELTRLTSGAVV